ncbi:MAG: hypothetical protein KDB23_13095 [Planctomycetales bacterium]|nr:hypothetical protein [Planctomycetales bacterium]
MLRRTARTVDSNETQVEESWERPLVVQLVGVGMLVGSLLLLVGGARRTQSNMITSGLLFLSMGAIFSSNLLRAFLFARIAVVALALFGAYYALKT